MGICIGSADNTWNPCLLVLREKGYGLWSTEAEGEPSTWWATRDGNVYSGNIPAELLGIVTLGEHFGADWCRQEPDIIDQVMDAPSPFPEG